MRKTSPDGEQCDVVNSAGRICIRPCVVWLCPVFSVEYLLYITYKKRVGESQGGDIFSGVVGGGGFRARGNCASTGDAP